MGGFEVILVLIGLTWTIASAVMQKKAKAAKAARLQSLAKESSPATSSSIPVAESPRRAKATTLQDRLVKLREQILDSVEGTQQPRSKSTAAPTAVSAGPATIAVPQPKRTALQDMPQLPETAVETRPRPSTQAERSSGALNAHDLRRLLSDPGRLKEAMVLKEILGPPLSLRS